MRKYLACSILAVGIIACAAAAWHHWREPPAITEYKEKALAFLDEVGVLIKIVETDPLPTYEDSRGEKIIDQWARLPEPPAAYRKLHKDLIAVPAFVLLALRNHTASIELMDMKHLVGNERRDAKAAAKAELDNSLERYRGMVRELQMQLR